MSSDFKYASVASDLDHRRARFEGRLHRGNRVLDVLMRRRKDACRRAAVPAGARLIRVVHAPMRDQLEAFRRRTARPRKEAQREHRDDRSEGDLPNVHPAAESTSRAAGKIQR